MTGIREIGESVANSVLERVGRGMSRVQERKPLPNDLLESDDAYLVVFDAPGVQRSDVQVRFLDGEVRVRIDRFREFYEGFEMRFPGRGLSLDGSVMLPDDAAVDAEGASATLTDTGTLRIRIPKERRATDVEVVDEADEVDEDRRSIDEEQYDVGEEQAVDDEDDQIADEMDETDATDRHES
jgi:HSP20 family molecular chaperone IbpA